MKHSIKTWLIVLVTGISFSAKAQTAPALENLFRLDGNWQGPATLIVDGNTFNFTYYMSYRKTVDNSGMTMEESATHPDLGSLKGYNLIGFNARDEKIHWFSVDNFGTCHDHLGYWKTPDHFYMETTEKKGGKKFEEKIDVIFHPNGQVSFLLTAKLGGQVFQELSGTFTKQNP